MLLWSYLKTETEKKERRKEINCAKPSALAEWFFEHSQKRKVSYLLQETAYKLKRAGGFSFYFVLSCQLLVKITINFTGVLRMQMVNSSINYILGLSLNV